MEILAGRCHGMATQSRSRSRWSELLCVVGFFAVTAALLFAHSKPATGYETSIYAATPLGVWAGVAVAFACALVVSFGTTSHRHRILGIGLGGAASAAVVALPILRGYYFYGRTDAQAHVGWTRAIADGTTPPVDLLYPGIHNVAAFIQSVTGLPVWGAMLFVPVVAVLAFFVFVPLVVRELLDLDMATTVGAFSAFLVVPVHLIANSLRAHPSSLAVLLTPVFLFLLVRYLRSTDSTSRFGFTSAIGAGLLLTVFGLILYHPQQALNVVLLLGVVAVVQFVTRSNGTPERTGHRSVYSVTGIAVVAFLLWSLQQPTVFLVTSRGLSAIQAYLTGNAPAAGSSVASQTSALQAVGASLPVIYLKLFFVSTVFALVSGFVVLGAFADYFDPSESPLDTAIVRYLGLGLLVQLVVFAVYLFGDLGAYYFRQAGFMIMVGTVLGAIGITYAARALSGTRPSAGVRTSVALGFAIMLVLSVMVVFNSPYIYKPNGQVTEADVTGYEATFQLAGEDGWVVGVRSRPQTFYDSTVGMRNNGRRDGTLNSSQLHRLQDHRDDAYYLVVTRTTYVREVEAYQGYRYSRADLAAVDRQVGVNRVFSNGQVNLYQVA